MLRNALLGLAMIAGATAAQAGPMTLDGEQLDRVTAGNTGGGGHGAGEEGGNLGIGNFGRYNIGIGNRGRNNIGIGNRGRGNIGIGLGGTGNIGIGFGFVIGGGGES